MRIHDLDELIEVLIELREEVGGKATVAAAHQPTLPLVGDVIAAIAVTDPGEEEPATVFLAISPDEGYLSGAVAQELQNEGWES
jgi:poly-beta-hydroxyalkanoate depolymerase